MKRIDLIRDLNLNPPKVTTLEDFCFIGCIDPKIDFIKNMFPDRDVVLLAELIEKFKRINKNLNIEQVQKLIKETVQTIYKGTVLELGKHPHLSEDPELPKEVFRYRQVDKDGISRDIIYIEKEIVYDMIERGILKYGE